MNGHTLCHGAANLTAKPGLTEWFLCRARELAIKPGFTFRLNLLFEGMPLKLTNNCRGALYRFAEVIVYTIDEAIGDWPAQLNWPNLFGRTGGWLVATFMPPSPYKAA